MSFGKVTLQIKVNFLLRKMFFFYENQDRNKVGIVEVDTLS